MKTKLALLSIISLTLVAQAGTFTPGVNPAPVIQLGWTASPDPTVDGYRLYYGPSSGNYTNVVSLGNLTNYSFGIPVRGTPYFFVVTATAAGLESLPSNEINYTAKAPPASPGMKPPIVLVVQTKPMGSPAAQWADNQTVQVVPIDPPIDIRLKLGPANEVAAVMNPQVASAQVRAVHALRAAILMPPAPNAR